MKVKSLSHVRLLATPWTAAYQAPPSMGFSKQEYWSGVPLPSPKLILNSSQDVRKKWQWSQPQKAFTQQALILYRVCVHIPEGNEAQRRGEIDRELVVGTALIICVFSVQFRDEVPR